MIKITDNFTVQSGCGGHHHAHRANSRKKSIDKRLRDYFIKTNLDLIIIGLLLALYSYQANAAEAEDNEHHDAASVESQGGEGDTFSTHDEEHSDESHASHRSVHAVLFPWFAQIIGIFAYYFLSRYAHALPFTAVMFVLGFAIGYCVQANGERNILGEAAVTWMSTPGQLILLIFLPGLLFVDAYHIDVHLFVKSFSQLLIFAFPCVLAGTALTACIAYYIFPYGWSFDLCMTFGSILSATDPVAVAVLLGELGAPPRLKMHVSGESLLNDGSAYVFYTIFQQRFFYELMIPGVGSSIGWGEGFKLFFQLALGGCAIGLAFGLGVVILLFALNRRLSGEDSLAQVVTTITAAYLSYFSAEVAGCSGIIAVLFLGVTVKSLGITMINSPNLMLHFWEITEWLLNTLLFTLAGCEWGYMMRDDPDTLQENDSLLNAKDWGYLILLFVLLLVIRAVLMFGVFPINSRIGIGQSWQEACFMSYSGLRGAVGIALALALNAEVWQSTSNGAVDEETMHQYRAYTEKIFGFVGGIALLTLIVNAPTCGWLLKKLGLVTPTETRLDMIENYRRHMIHNMLVEYVAMISEKRFEQLDYTVAKEHVPFLRDITYEQVIAAVEEHKANTPQHLYSVPNLKNLLPYLKNKDDDAFEIDNSAVEELRKHETKRRTDLLRNRCNSLAKINKTEHALKKVVFDYKKKMSMPDDATVQELRNIFINTLRTSYNSLIDSGELEARSFIAYSLLKSLDIDGDLVARGHSLNDYVALQVASSGFLKHSEAILHQILQLKQAHDIAKSKFSTYCAEVQADKKSKSGPNSIAQQAVIEEVDAQIKLADDALKELDQDDVTQITSHYACQVLLNKSAFFFQTLAKQGLMTEKEASEFMDEIEDDVIDTSECQKAKHDGELTDSVKRGIMLQLSKSFGLKEGEEAA